VKISTRTEYGVRILLSLAREHGNGPISLRGIAKRERLPHAYLEQLALDLRRAGLVIATRGQAGGYQLARSPASISMADAVRALEGPLLEMPCAGTDTLEACDRPVPCSVHDLFQRVHESLSNSLGGTTLAEAAASAGGPPYPTSVRRRNAAQVAAAQAASRAGASTQATQSVHAVQATER
jgi:Rrf2 family cysteine metabolism transcriptional repressor